MSSNVDETRQSVIHLNAELRTFNNLAASGQVSGQDLLVILRTMGLSPQINRAIRDLQMFIAVSRTAGTTAKLLGLELGPVGWAIIGITTVGGIIASETGVLDNLGR